MGLGLAGVEAGAGAGVGAGVGAVAVAVGLGLGVGFGFGFGLELGNRCEFSWMSKTTGRAVVSLLDISFLYFTYKTHGHAGQLGGGPTR